MFENATNTLRRGAVGLARAIFEYQRLGYTVCLPLVDAQDYDLAIEKDGEFKTVQCKATSYKKAGVYQVGLGSIRVNTKQTRVIPKGSFDLLFVLCNDGTCYSIPNEETGNHKLSLGKKYDQYKLHGGD